MMYQMLHINLKTNNMSKEYVCSICNEKFEPIGHNAQPINDGRCCTKCNYGVVIPARVQAMNELVADLSEPEMPEGGWECSECGAPVKNMNDYCSQSCFNAGMR